MRIVALNIRHGGGRRIDAIANAILAHEPDVVVLSEFHASQNGSRLLEKLAEAGLADRAQGEPGSTAYPNSVAIASRLALTDARFPLVGSANGQRVLEVDVGGLIVGAVYFPLGKPKVDFWRDEFLPYAATRIGRPTVLVGDWNSGRHLIDETGATLDGSVEFETMTNTGWVDAWRSQHPNDHEYTWYSAFGNGFRLDHAFLSPSVAPRLVWSRYDHDTRRPGVTDHSALVVELAP